MHHWTQALNDVSDFFPVFFFLFFSGMCFISKFYWQSKVGHYWKQNTRSWSILMNGQLLACSLSETNGERKESTEDSLSRDLTWTFQSLRDFQDSHRNLHRKMLHFLIENQTEERKYRGTSKEYRMITSHMVSKNQFT